MKHTKKYIEKKLKEKKCVVTFNKVSTGEERIMECTLNFDFIPADKHPTGTGHAVENENTFRVFDLNKQDWRSFNYDTVTNFKVKRG